MRLFQSTLVLVALLMVWSSLTKAPPVLAESTSHSDDRDRSEHSTTTSVRFVGVTTERFIGSGTRSAMTRA